MKRAFTALPALALLGIADVAKADCSLGGDPFGVVTEWTAFATVNTHTPPGLFLLSDLSVKFPALPTSGIAVAGTPFEDPLYSPYATVVVGLNGGSDVLMAADPSAPRPGAGKVVILQGGYEDNGSRRGDLFILGDYKKAYYAGKTSVMSADNDLAYLDRLDPSADLIRLHGRPSDYRLAWITGLVSGVLQGTALVTQQTCDVIGFIRNVAPWQLSPLIGKNFEYATKASPTPALPSPTAPQIIPVDQLGGTGSAQWPGPYTSVDEFGNIYMAWASSAPSLAGAGGPGSWYLAKYNRAGARVWIRKFGLNAAKGPQVPVSSEVFGSSLYVAGFDFGGWAGTKPPTWVTGASGSVAFLAKFDANTGTLQRLTRLVPEGPGTDEVAPFNVAADNKGDLYICGSTNAGLSVPFTSPFLMKIKGSDLSVDPAFNGGKAVIFRDGPPIIFNSLNLFLDAGNLQFANFCTETHFVPDRSGVPGKGFVYVSGSSDDGQFFNSNPGWNDVWFSKLDATTGAVDPSPLWHGRGRSLSAPNADSFNRGAATDRLGNLYVSGMTGGDFHAYDPSVPVLNPSTNGGNFVAKIDPTGAVIWVRYLAATNVANILDMHESNGHLYVYGDTWASLYAQNRGGTDIWMAELDLNGNVLGGSQFGTSGFDWATDLEIRGNTLSITGMTEGSMAKAHESVLDVFLAKVNLRAR